MRRIPAPVAQSDRAIAFEAIGRGFDPCLAHDGRVAELADAHGLGPCAERLGGSSPLSPSLDISYSKLDIRN